MAREFLERSWFLRMGTKGKGGVAGTGKELFPLGTVWRVGCRQGRGTESAGASGTPGLCGPEDTSQGAVGTAWGTGVGCQGGPWTALAGLRRYSDDI